VDVLLWSAVAAAFVGLLVLDLVVFSRGAHEVSLREAGVWSGVWLAVGLAFALVVWGLEDAHHAGGYLAGYLIERSLSVDNVFVFALVLTYFAVPARSQGRVLFLGVLGALVLRAGFIVVGAAMLDAFHWMDYVFGAFLVVTAFRMFRARAQSPKVEGNRTLRGVRRVIPSTAGYHGESLVVRERGRLRATPMVAVLLAVALVDVVFAVDSIPAIFAVTRDPFIVFTSNAFAVLGMRAMYFLLAGMMDRFAHLKVGLAAVLALVGVKMLAGDLYEAPVWASLVAIVLILGVSIAVSLRRRPASMEGVIDETVPGGASVDRAELTADRGEHRGSGAPAGGRGDDGDTRARPGRDHPRPVRTGDRVRVGAPRAREGSGAGEAGSRPDPPNPER
jgi:tellurite resistance protein TerC